MAFMHACLNRLSALIWASLSRLSHSYWIKNLEVLYVRRLHSTWAPSSKSFLYCFYLLLTLHCGLCPVLYPLTQTWLFVSALAPRSISTMGADPNTLKPQGNNVTLLFSNFEILVFSKTYPGFQLQQIWE